MDTLRGVGLVFSLDFASSFAVAAEAIAQTIPPSVQPGAIEHQLKNRSTSLCTGKIQIPAPESPAAPANASTVPVRLRTIDVE